MISLFSLKRNMAILFSTTANRNDVRCLHGIRFLSVYFIVYGHRFVHDLATPVVNYMDLVDVSKQKLRSQFIFNPKLVC